jgi:hypothetical protein
VIQDVKEARQRSRRPAWKKRRVVDEFEESLDKMEATDLVANPDAKEPVLEQQELRNEESEVDSVWGLKTRYRD